MKQANPTAARLPWLLAAVVAVAAIGAALPAAAGAQNAPAAGSFAKIEGYVNDSVHAGPLANALVFVEGVQRQASTDDEGHYVIDSIPPGQHRILLVHPLLDTLGVGQLRTAPLDFKAGETKDFDMAIPSAERIVGVFCSPPQRLRGPAAMIGFVRDPDTKAPAVGAEVQVIYYVPDLAGRKQLRRGSAIVDSTGMYHICGLAGDMSGKVQVYRNKVSSGEVPVDVTNGFLALRSFSVASQQTTVAVQGDSGKLMHVAKGTARVAGKVINKKGEPVVGAHVELQGGDQAAVTNARGEFTLDSLPSGTQAIEVRKLPYAVTEAAVELSANTATRTTVTMSDATVLATVRVEAAVDKGLSKVGYLERKNANLGYFMDGKQINHQMLVTSDVLRNVPGLVMVPSGNGRTNVIKDSRNQASGCVNYYVDNSPYTEMTPGDLDDYIRPDEIVAVEVYHGAETPPQFTRPGASSCATIVIWTQARISTAGGKTP